MPVEPGQMLSHYRLIEKIGEGGMGVVWKARDEKLRRDVALKVLPAQLVEDPERRRRLLREARSAAAINHPNIGTVYEVDEAEGTVFIAMELVEGKTLRSLLHGKPLAIPEALRIATETAEGLVAAHQANVIHRDLKPENILIRPDGVVKILDFGLAVHEEPQPAGAHPSQVETVTQRMTREGHILGTPAYMSPEQARGEAVDARSDLFSFGSMLYEMATGKMPFEGRTHADTLAAILKEPAGAASQRNVEVPVGLDRVLHKCLEKSRESRYQHADELTVDLRRLSNELVSGSSPSYEKLGPIKKGRRASWTLAGTVVLILAVLGVWQMRSRMGGGVDPQTLLILSLEVRGQGEGAEYAGRAFSETLAANLAQADNLKVLPVPDAEEFGEKSVFDRLQAAYRLGAGRLLSGVITRDDTSVHVRISLVDTAENQVLWGTEQTATPDGLSFLASDLARAIAGQLGGVFRRFYDSYLNMTDNPVLSDSLVYLEALEAIRRTDQPAALEATQRLIAAFPNAPEAQVLRLTALWRRASSSEASSPERVSFEDALHELARIDPENPWDEYFRARADHQLDNRISEAVDLHTMILQRNDLTPSARAMFLGHRGELRVYRTGDTEGGMQDLEEARRLDPMVAGPYLTLAYSLCNSFRPVECLLRARQAAALEPGTPGALRVMTYSLRRNHRFAEAAEFSRGLCDAHGDQWSCAYHALMLQRVGRQKEAREAAEFAASLEPGVDATGYLAAFWAREGERDEAIRLLDRLAAAGSSWHLWSDMDLISLHGDPEFEALASRQNEMTIRQTSSLCDKEQTTYACAQYATSLQLAGREKEASEVAERAASFPGTRNGAYKLAAYYARSGRRDEALRSLRRAIELGFADPFQIDENVNFQSLRGDPQLDTIVAEVEARLKDSE